MTKKQTAKRKGQTRSSASASKVSTMTKSVLATLGTPMAIGAMIFAASAVVGFVLLRPRGNREWIAKQFGGLTNAVSKLSANIFKGGDTASSAMPANQLDGAKAIRNGGTYGHSA